MRGVRCLTSWARRVVRLFVSDYMRDAHAGACRYDAPPVAPDGMATHAHQERARDREHGEGRLALDVRTPLSPSPPSLNSAHSWNRGQGRKIYTREMREGLKVHRSVKTRLETLADAGALSHPLSRGREDTHVRVAVPRSVYDAGAPHETERTAEVYVPQVRPKFPGKHRAPARLSWAEWNVEVPKYWEWAD